MAELTFDVDGHTESLPFVAAGDDYHDACTTLCKIDPMMRWPGLRDAVLEPSKVLGNRAMLLANASRLRPEREAVKACERIQSVYRRKRAARLVARVRYAYWSGSRARRVAMLQILAATGSTHLTAVKQLVGLGVGLRVVDFCADLPAWEAPELSANSVPAAFARRVAELQRKDRARKELALRLKLRRLRVRELRRGAAVTTVLREKLLLAGKGTASKLSAIAAVREDRAGDAKRWSKFATAAPNSRCEFRVFQADKPAHVLRAFARAFARNAFARPLAAALNRAGLMRAAYAVHGADATLALARRRNTANRNPTQTSNIPGVSHTTVAAHLPLPKDSVLAIQAPASRISIQRWRLSLNLSLSLSLSLSRGAIGRERERVLDSEGKIALSLSLSLVFWVQARNFALSKSWNDLDNILRVAKVSLDFLSRDTASLSLSREPVKGVRLAGGTGGLAGVGQRLFTTGMMWNSHFWVFWRDWCVL